MLIKYKIIIAYDGTDYFGWQRQKEKLAVAQVLQDTFATVFSRKIILYGVSRTDAGVHAVGQVAIFATDLVVDTQKMMRAWNNLLPSAISIRSVEIAPEHFHLHANVVSKTYWYHFFSKPPLPFFARYGWYYRYPVDIKKLQECLNVFIGTHDFRSFSTGDERGDDTIRTIHSASIEYIARYNAYRIEIVGPKFLHHMVRRMAGACIEVASREDLKVEKIKQVLEAKNPDHILPNAPAKGLMLYKIKYKDMIQENLIKKN
jgi:tRNA pseudouridine38-40 synthase